MNPSSKSESAHTSGVHVANLEQRRASEVRRRAFGPRVLLIDDDADARHLMTQILVKRGAEVVGSSGPAQAMDLISMFEDSDRPWSLVILDVMMPGLDGSAFIRELYSIPSVAGAPVLLHSALSAVALEKTVRDWRAQGYIMKTRGLLHIDTSLESWLARVAVMS